MYMKTCTCTLYMTNSVAPDRFTSSDVWAGVAPDRFTSSDAWAGVVRACSLKTMGFPAVGWRGHARTCVRGVELKLWRKADVL